MFQLPVPGAQASHVSLAGGKHHPAVPEFACIARLARALLDNLHALDRHVPGITCQVGTQVALQNFQIGTKTRQQLAAIATGRGRSDTRSLKHHHPVAALGQLERAGKTCSASTDHHHVGMHHPVQLASGRTSLDGVFVVAVPRDRRCLTQHRTSAHEAAPVAGLGGCKAAVSLAAA